MSVRLDREIEALIRRLAKAAGRSRSWVVREAVVAYAGREPLDRSPYEILAPFIGAGDIGRRDLSDRTGERFAELLRVKSRARGAR
jgi:hypothetical protein